MSRQVKQLPLLTLNGSSKTTDTMQLLVKITWGIDDLTPTMQSNGDFTPIFFNFAILPLLFKSNVFSTPVL
jgi:hypothetical protein